MGSGAAADRLVTALRLGGQVSAQDFCRTPAGSMRSPLQTSSSIRRVMRSSDWCRSKRCSAARRSSSADDSGCGEVIARVGGGLIVPPGDSAALSDAIASVLNSPRRMARPRRDGGRQGSRAVRRRHRLRSAGARVSPRSAAPRSLTAGSSRDEHRCRRVSFVIPVLNGRRMLRLGARCHRSPARRPAIRNHRSSTTAARMDRWRCCTSGRLQGVEADCTVPAAAPRRPSMPAFARHRTRSSARSIRTSSSSAAGSRRCSRPCDPDVAAAQGHYVLRPDAGFWARAMGRDLEQRYSRIAPATSITSAPATRHIAQARFTTWACSMKGSATATTTT